MSTATADTASPTSRARCAGPCAGLCTAEGFAAAHREHRARLTATAARMLPDRESAEDAVQEVFVRAWRACASFDPAVGPPPAAWLRTILRHVVIDMVRARAVRPPSSRTAPPDVADGRAGVMDRVVTRLVLLDALSGLSAEHCAVVVRTVLRDRPYADVAVELDLPVGTVKSRVFYALRGLRGRLGPDPLSLLVPTEET